MEVKSYKCDICGKVYHVDPETNDWVMITTSERNDDIVDQTNYDHLCPDCMKNIKAYINKPEIAEEARKTRRAVSKLEDCLHRISNRVFFLKSFWFGAGIDAPEHYDDFTDDIVKKIDELAEYQERSRKQMIVIRVLAGVIGFFIGCALAQLL